MTPRYLTRTACLAAAFFVALAGCKKKEIPPSKKPNVATETATPANPDNTTPANAKPIPARPLTSSDIEAASLKTAQDFLTAFGEGKATDASLTVSFLKVIGKPLGFEKSRAYNANEAKAGWNRVGNGLTFSAPTGSAVRGCVFFSLGPIKERIDLAATS